MKMPFTTEQFFTVFENYNLTFFPSQIIIVLFGLIVAYLIHSKNKYKNEFIGGFLSILWIWIGIAYHISFFSNINKVAYLFGAVFIFQGILFLINTFITKNLIFSSKRKIGDYFAYIFILYGLIIYPLIGLLVEGSITRTITLGLPCPSTIFTFGFLLLANNRLPKYILIIPCLWAFIGTSAAINFGVYQDYLLIVVALASTIILSKSNIKLKNT